MESAAEKRRGPTKGPKDMALKKTQVADSKGGLSGQRVPASVEFFFFPIFFSSYSSAQLF